MKLLAFSRNLLITIFVFTAYPSMGQKATVTHNSHATNALELKTYVIERDIPGAGKMTTDQLKKISQTSCKVLKEMGFQIQWIHSYVTENKIFCIYKAESEELIREHAKKGGFPANAIYEVATIISPATAN